MKPIPNIIDVITREIEVPNNIYPTPITRRRYCGIDISSEDLR